MRNSATRKIWILAFLMAICVAGCGREQTVNPAPLLVSTLPANGATSVPIKQVVTATFNMAMNSTTINASTFTMAGPGGTAVVGAVTYSGVTAQFTPAVPLLPGTVYTATATVGAQNVSGDALSPNYVWTFTTGTIPTVTSTVPANGAINVLVGQPISATFSEAMNSATITAPGTFTVSVAGVGGAAVSGTVTYAAASNTATFTPTSNLLGSTAYTATVNTAAQNPAGNSLAASSVWAFTTAAVPTVLSTTPANGAINVPVTQKITATFSLPMNAATVTASGTFTVAVAGPGGAAVPGTVTYVAGTNTATFSPTSNLLASTAYTATINTAAQSVPGNSLAANSVWSFTTAAIPTVISTSPANGATNVPLNQKIIANFSIAMNPATILAPGTFTVAVAGVGGAAVPGTVTYLAATNTATFTPTVNLLASTAYTATISTAAQSAAGNSLAVNYIWSFTTGQTANTTPPQVLSTDPISAATNVPVNQKIAATFSAVMDPATITAPGTFTVAVAGVGGASVPGTVTYAGSTATFTPTANLAATTQYTATITNAATDLSGNALAAGPAPNPWSFTTGAGPDVTPPTITLTSPANAAINVATNATVNATFSKAMDPVTLTAPGTFTLAVSGAGGAAVAGSVAYDSVSHIATFTPAANLTASTQYTATITKAAKDLAGNALAAGTTPNPWTFTIGASAGPTGPNLGVAATFGSFGGGAGVTNQGINTIINGDLGTTGASTLVTGFHDAGPGCVYTETGSNIGTVNGNIDTAPPPPTGGCLTEGTATTFAIATQAATDALAAYNNLAPASRPGGSDPGAGQLGALVLPPGIYKAAGGSFLLTGSDLTLDGQGNTNAIWVFQMASSLTVGDPGTPRSVILVNGAQAKNVFWQVGSAATINPAGGGTMVGTIIASAGVTFSTAGNAAITTLNGRALGLNASVTMVNTVINVPAP